MKTVPALIALLEKPAQDFFIDAYSDTTLYGNEGTVIFIQPSCLRTSDSSMYQGKITIQLKELYTKEALLRERAFTISNGSMLESDGSLYYTCQPKQESP